MNFTIFNQYFVRIGMVSASDATEALSYAKKNFPLVPHPVISPISTYLQDKEIYWDFPSSSPTRPKS